MKLLRYTGHDGGDPQTPGPAGPEAPDAVDPYWDFERSASPADLRIWRMRVTLPGDAPSAVRLVLSREHDDEHTRLAPARHVRRFLGGEPHTAHAWAPIGDAPLVVEPPNLVLGVNLTPLPPGDYLLTAIVEDTPHEDLELAFRLVRRPIFTFPTDQQAFSARPATGLVRVDHPTYGFATAHAWDVLARPWIGDRYGDPTPFPLSAVTLLSKSCKPVITRFREGAVPSPMPLDLEGLLPPSAHARYGLPFPTLTGLPSQPDGEGSFARRKPARPAEKVESS